MFLKIKLLKSILLLCLLNSTSFTFSNSNPVKNNILRFNKNNISYVLLKGSKVFSATHDDYTLFFDFNSKVNFEAQFNKNNKKVIISQLENRLSVYKEIPHIYFNQGKTCSYEDFKNKKMFFLNDISMKLSSDAISKYIDKSCTENVQTQKIIDSLNDFLMTRREDLEKTKSNSSIYKCVQSDLFSNYVSKYPSLADLAIRVMTKYENLLNEIKHNKKNDLIFTCETLKNKNSNKTAKFERTPQNINKISFFLDTNKTPLNSHCKTTEQLILHEFSHYANLDEDQTKIIDSICNEVVGKKETSKDCAREYFNAKELDDFLMAKAPKKNKTKQLHLLELANQERKTEPEKIKDIMQEAPSLNDWKPVTEPPGSVLETLSSQSISSQSPEYQAAVSQLTHYAEATLGSVIKPLNEVMAVVSGPQARAIPSSLQLGNIQSGMETGLTNTNSSLKNYNSKTSNPAQSEIFNYQSETAQRISRERDASRAAVEEAFQDNFNQDGKSPKINNLKDPEILNQEASTVGRSKFGQHFNSEKIRVDSDDNPIPSQNLKSSPSSQASGNNISYFTEILGSFNEVKGDSYQQIQKLYQNSQFIQNLKSKGISIQTSQFGIIGASPQSTKQFFRDSGNSLEKMEMK